MAWKLIERFIGYIDEIGEEDLLLCVNSMSGEEAIAVLPISRIPYKLRKQIEIFADIEIRVMKDSSTVPAQWKTEYSLTRWYKQR